MSEKAFAHLPSPDVMARARKIKLFLMDVDGTLTYGGVCLISSTATDGSGIPAVSEMKVFNAHDGQRLSLAHTMGIQTGFITGRHSPAVAKRPTEGFAGSTYPACPAEVQCDSCTFPPWCRQSTAKPVDCLQPLMTSQAARVYVDANEVPVACSIPTRSLTTKPAMIGQGAVLAPNLSFWAKNRQRDAWATSAYVDVFPASSHPISFTQSSVTRLGH